MSIPTKSPHQADFLLSSEAALLKTSLDALFHEDLGGNFLDGEMRRVDVGNVFAAEQVFHFADFELALGEAGITAVGFALVANRGQAIRIDGEAEQLLPIGLQHRGKLQAL